MERLVAITFTIAAAGELRVRIREELEAAAAGAATTSAPASGCHAKAAAADAASQEYRRNGFFIGSVTGSPRETRAAPSPRARPPAAGE